MKVGDLVQKKWSKLKGVGVVVEIVFNGKVEHARVFWATQNVELQNHCTEGLVLLK